MRVIRFLGYLVVPWLTPLLLIPLAIFWLVSSLILYIWTTWDNAKQKKFKWQI